MVGTMDPDLNTVQTPMANGKENSEIESLPDELLFNILLHLSVEDIYNGAMLVCRNWYKMIRGHDFIHTHLKHSTPVLLVHNYSRKYNGTTFVAIKEGRIEVSKFSYKIMGRDWWTSCNGLIMEYLLLPIRITNPAIKQQFRFPPFPCGKKARHRCSSMAYSATSKHYKVVHTCDELVNYGDFYGDLWCYILIVGVDESWRRVSTQHLSPTSDNLLRKNPITTEGFIHWTEALNHVHLLTLNVETETIKENPVPLQGSEERFRYYLSAGKSLSMFVRCGEMSLEGWDMNPETGEWTKLYNIDLKDQKCIFEHLFNEYYCHWDILVPVGWLKCKEVLVLRFGDPTRVCIAYNVCTQEIDLFELDSDTDFHVFNIHTNSLAWLP